MIIGLSSSFAEQQRERRRTSNFSRELARIDWKLNRNIIVVCCTSRRTALSFHTRDDAMFHAKNLFLAEAEIVGKFYFYRAISRSLSLSAADAEQKNKHRDGGIFHPTAEKCICFVCLRRLNGARDSSIRHETHQKTSGEENRLKWLSRVFTICVHIQLFILFQSEISWDTR